MSGHPRFNYPAFETAATDLQRAGFAALNPADVEDRNPTPGTPQSWEWYLRQTLPMVCAADAMALLPGWEMSHGATLEHGVARALNLPCQPVQNWLDEGAAA